MTIQTAAATGASGLDLELSVAGQRFRCRVGAGTEVGPAPRLTRVPRTPGWLAGLIVARDRVVPVVYLGRVLGLDPDHASPAAADRLVTLRERGLAVGFLVDDVQGGASAGLPALDLGNVAGALSQRLEHGAPAAQVGG